MFYKFSSTSLRSKGCVDAVWENKGRSAHVTLKGSLLPLHLQLHQKAHPKCYYQMKTM